MSSNPLRLTLLFKLTQKNKQSAIVLDKKRLQDSSKATENINLLSFLSFLHSRSDGIFRSTKDSKLNTPTKTKFLDSHQYKDKKKCVKICFTFELLLKVSKLNRSKIFNLIFPLAISFNFQLKTLFHIAFHYNSNDEICCLFSHKHTFSYTLLSLVQIFSFAFFYLYTRRYIFTYLYL